jgi:hypothetical protein
VLEIPRIVPSFSLPQVDSVADLESYSRSVPVHVRGVGSFDRLDNGAWCPLDIHPEYSNYTLVGALLASALDPADPDAVVTDDLPTGFNLDSRAETGLAKLTANGLELHSGDGTAVSSASSVSLAFTGAMVPAADEHRTVVLARHAWADDGSIAASDAARANMSLRLASNGRTSLWMVSSPNGGGAGLSSQTNGAGALLAALLSVTGQPRGEVWEMLSYTRGVADSTGASGVRRLAGEAGHILGSLPAARRSSWASIAENAVVRYLARNSTAASTAVVKIYIRELLVFRQGAAA